MLILNNPLYEKQKRGYEKLKRYKVGALFMEMGTGKTRTMLEIVQDKYEAGKIEKVLWFCPCSAKLNIKKELEKQVKDGREIFLIAGLESISSSISLVSYLYKFVQTYKTMIVVDESLKIKNFFAKRSQVATKLAEYSEYRYILNGTEISRDERDLFSQFYFLDWRILGYRSYWSFCNNHVMRNENGMVVDLLNVEYLTKSIEPYAYSLKLSECADLPGKNYKKRYFYLIDSQWTNYNQVADYLIEQLDERKPSTIYRLFTCLQLIASGYHISFDERGNTIKEKLFSYENNPRVKAFMDVIGEMEDNKAIIFCKYNAEIIDVKKALEKRYGKKTIAVFYGKSNKKQREKAMKSFEQEAQFLVTNKDCVGMSWNLQFCTRAIYYNNDWDFGTRAQSEKRIYRIGQKNKVVYIDIVANGTIEEKILTCLERKEKLLSTVKKSLKEGGTERIAEMVMMYRRDGKYKRSKVIQKEIKVLEELTDEDLQRD